MDTLTALLSAGDNAGYIALAFGFAAVLLLALLLQSVRAARQRDSELEDLRRLVRRKDTPEKPRRPIVARRASRDGRPSDVRQHS